MKESKTKRKSLEKNETGEDENLGKENPQKHPNKIRQRQGTKIDNKHKTAKGGHTNNPPHPRTPTFYIFPPPPRTPREPEGQQIWYGL